MRLAFSKGLGEVSVFLEGDVKQSEAKSETLESRANRSYVSRHGAETLFNENLASF
jgi:hypothetical protein